jgi:hypothetical protein
MLRMRTATHCSACRVRDSSICAPSTMVLTIYSTNTRSCCLLFLVA